jgi:hypothetical protein
MSLTLDIASWKLWFQLAGCVFVALFSMLPMSTGNRTYLQRFSAQGVRSFWIQIRPRLLQLLDTTHQ